MTAQLAVPEIASDTDTLTAALAYADHGWYVLPVRMDTKNPGSVVGNDWPLRSSRDPKQIAAWFAGTNYGIALHCGRSGAIVLDVDIYDNVPDEVLTAIETTGCPYQSTRPDQPGRGHYLFANTTGRRIGNGLGRLATASKWGEVRGANGVIIAAPSPHSEGGDYQWQRTGPLPPTPDYIADAVPESTTPEDTATDAEVQTFLDEYVDGSRPEVLHGLTSILQGKFETGSRHDGAVPITVRALEEARAGYYPAKTAVDALRTMFVAAATRAPTGEETQRTHAQAEDEYRGIVAWAVGQANAADLDEVRARVEKKMPEDKVVEARKAMPRAPSEVFTLAEAHATFAKWFGADYDLDAVNACLAAAAVERFTDGSDLVWLLLISGPGNAKTETVQALSGLEGAVITSSLSSEAALLSATSKRDRTKDSTGGLLRRMGEQGVLIIKDVTSILSANRDVRARVLAALREVYDGSWYREVGTDGGQSIAWKGRIAVVGAVTTAWDAAHAVISTMGDRFIVVRIDSTRGRQAAGRKAIGNTGSEKLMRAELAAAAAGVIAGMSTDQITVTEEESAVLLAAGDLVTLARTGVEYDYRGDVIDAHAPEMPTRFVKQLTQIVRGSVAIGMDRADALRLAIRCARDSMPPLRLAIIEDLAAHDFGECTTSDVRRRIGKPRSTVDRQLQALHMLGVAVVEEIEYGPDKARWYYQLAAGMSPAVLDLESFPEMSLNTPNPKGSEGVKDGTPCIPPDISGKDSGAKGTSE